MSRDPRRAAQVSGLLVLVCAMASLHIFDDDMVALHSLYLMGITSAGTVVHAVMAWRGSGRVRWVWALTAAAMAFWAFAEISVGIPAVTEGVAPGRGPVADALNLAALGLAIAAMLIIPSAPGTGSGKSCMALDGGVTAASLLGIVWVLALGPMAERTGSDAEAVIELSYPVLTVGVLAVALFLLSRQPIRQVTAMTFIAGGMAVLAGNLLLEIIGVVTEQEWLRPWVLGGFMAGAALLAVSALYPLPRGENRTWAPSTRVSSLMPYLPTSGFIAVALASTSVRKGLPPQVIWIGMLVVGLVLARQFLALRLNVALARDLERERTRFALEAVHDTLTGVPNRALLNATLVGLDLVPPERSTPALLMVDLDGFKAVNDALGHAAGDQLLVAVAQCLRQVTTPLGKAALTARLGGDEFAVLLHDGGLDRAREVAEDVLRALAVPMVLDGRPIAIRASIGIAVRTPGVSAEHLLHDADMALYEAKNNSKGQYRLFDRGMAAALEAQRRLQTDLARALNDGQFTLVYQPIIDLATGMSHSSEALLRWEHPHRGTLGPDSFVPAAADAGLLPDIDRWVLSAAISQLAGWRAIHPHYTVGVNVSAPYLASGTIVDDVCLALGAHRLPASALTIEVTETSLIANLDEAAKTLRRLRGLGVRVALDDFGVGYSSLTYLRELPVDIVKIDRSFIGDFDRDPRAAILIGNVLDLVHGLGLDCVAEGVEHLSQVAHLQAFRCKRAQGFLFARPRRAGDVLAGRDFSHLSPGPVAGELLPWETRPERAGLV